MIGRRSLRSSFLSSFLPTLSGRIWDEIHRTPGARSPAARSYRRATLDLGMDGGAFEQFVLRVVEAHGRAVTPAELAALMGIPVRTAERALGRLAEAGMLKARANRDGEAEFYLGRRASKPSSPSEDPGVVPDPAAAFGAPGSPLMAVLLSLMVPGAGHVYAGRTGAGVAWMAGTLAGYACCLVPGLLLHGLCLVSAAQRRGY